MMHRFLIGVMVLLTGCTAMLPQARQNARNPWSDFASAKHSFDQITVFSTSLDRVHELGFDPATTANMQLLNQAQVVTATVPSPLLERAQLPLGVRECMRVQEACMGYLIESGGVSQNRVGNFLLDFLNFRRTTVTSGWKFTALIVVVDNMVVYKQWNGQPHIESTDERVNPLGPLQSMGETMKVLP